MTVAFAALHHSGPAFAASTNEFDTEAGAIENMGKRQVWRKGEGKRIEHIGIIMAIPDDPDDDIIPAAGWAKLEKVFPRILQPFSTNS